MVLKEISIDSNSVYPDPNEEVINATLQCPKNPNSEFTTTYCKTGTALIEQTIDGFSFVNQEFFIEGDACEESINNTLEDLYFSFFTSNSDQLLTVEILILHDPDLSLLWLYAPNGDFVYYESIPQELLGIDNFNRQRIVISPNPIIDSFSIQNNSSAILTNLKIIDINGKVVQHFNTTILNNISAKNLSNGLYYLQLVTDDGKMIAKKILIE
jgi:hypothetical protein